MKAIFWLMKNISRNFSLNFGNFGMGIIIAVMEQESAVTLLKSGGEAYPPAPASL